MVSEVSLNLFKSLIYDPSERAGANRSARVFAISEIRLLRASMASFIRGVDGGLYHRKYDQQTKTGMPGSHGQVPLGQTCLSATCQMIAIFNSKFWDNAAQPVFIREV